jgi:hypothetical protein
MFSYRNSWFPFAFFSKRTALLAVVIVIDPALAARRLTSSFTTTSMQ